MGQYEKVMLSKEEIGELKTLPVTDVQKMFGVKE